MAVACSDQENIPRQRVKERVAELLKKLLPVCVPTLVVALRQCCKVTNNVNGNVPTTDVRVSAVVNVVGTPFSRIPIDKVPHLPTQMTLAVASRPRKNDRRGIRGVCTKQA